MTPRWALALGLVVLSACSAGRRASLGGECELNSDCSAPLVCRIGFCRNECATSGDCSAGLSCLLDENDLGVCQLAEEASCTLASDCPAPLVCRFNECTNACNDDRDCLGGARCRIDPAGNACIDPSSRACTLDGECGAAEFCLSGRCRQECFTDRDCRRGWRCNVDALGGECVDPTFDAGPRDVGPTDVSSSDAPVDGGGSSCTIGPLVGVQSFALGADFGCAITDDGTSHLFCWGANPSGARGTLVDTYCATEVAAFRGLDLREIAASLGDACVRLGSGEVQCMGDNFYGTLGRGLPGTSGGIPYDEVPQPIAGGVVATRIVGGSVVPRHFAFDSGGGILGWGENSYGTLAMGTTTHVGVPAPATMLAGATLIATGGVTCGAVSGTPVCFGGTLGPPPAGGTMITGTTDIAIGRQFACASDAASVYCWGDNVHGQLGDGGTISRERRAPTLPLPSAPRDLAAGDYHVCALLDTGELWCWGSRLGFDTSGTDGASPTPSLVASGVTAVGCGIDDTCILQAGRLLCTGRYGISLGIGMRERPIGFVEVVR